MSIPAELHDKMPFIYSEDILTSDVFTAFRSGASNTEDELDEGGEAIQVIGNQLAAEFQELQQGSYRVRAGHSSWQWLRLASAGS